MRTIESQAILYPVGVLSGLDDITRAQLASFGAFAEIDPGEVLIQEGDLQSALHVVMLGRLSVTTKVGGSTAELSDLGPGACLGEMGLVDEGAVASATVTAVERSTIWSIDAARFEEFISTNPAGAAMVLLATAKVLSGRLRSANLMVRRLNALPMLVARSAQSIPPQLGEDGTPKPKADAVPATQSVGARFLAAFRR